MRLICFASSLCHYERNTQKQSTEKGNESCEAEPAGETEHKYINRY